MSQLVSTGSPRARFTDEGGFAVLLTNGTGAPSVKGSLVSVSTSADRRFILQANEYDSIGVVYESGVADGSDCWVVVAGAVDVLFKDGVAPVRGSILLAADTDGRGDQTANPGGGLPGVDVHFKECGHVMESKSAGTSVLSRCMIHFN